MKIRPVVWAGLLATAILYSCTFTNAEDLAPECKPVTVSFQDTVFQIFQRYCWDTAGGGCHQAGAAYKPEWTDHAKISDKSDRIKVRAIDEQSMPPPFAPPEKLAISDCERAIIRDWIEAGSPDN